MTETITLGGEEISKIVTDPASGKETVITKVWIGGLSGSYTYTGSAIKPEFHVYDGTVKLTEKADYTLSWKKNRDVGTAAVTVKFKGNYKDSKSETVSFEIKPAVLGKDIIAHEIGATAKKTGSIKVSPVLTWAETGKAVSSKYFDIDPSSVASEGTVTATITPKSGQTNYTGSVGVTIRVVGDKNKLLGNAKVSFDQKSYSYTGSAIEPKYTLTLDGKTLTEGTDYQRVSLIGNTDPGTAKVIFEAVEGNASGYVGSKAASFKISGKKQLKEAGSDSPFTYTVEGGENGVPFAKGGARPSVTVKDSDSGQVLKEGRDYTLSYAKNKAVTEGSAEVRVKGKGSYKGSVILKYAIKQQDIRALSANILVSDQFTTRQKRRSPSVTITDLDGKKLKAGKDYTLGEEDDTAEDNTDASGVVYITIKGAAGYAEEVKASYRYIQTVSANIAKAKALKKVMDQEYTGNAVKLSKEELAGVLSLNGKTLVPGADFKVAGYSGSVKKGRAKVTLQGMGGCAGTKTLTFKIVQRNVAYQGALKDGAWK
ncbi:MAG: hypothetical protein K6F35_08590 [Lachnospiraceae bacterium]|nr:hypothetical protein [Lachnospiraceae bacterium]